MIDPLLRFVIQHRLLVIIGAGIAAIIGAVALTRLPIDAVPDITNNQVQINTVMPALPPQDVERQVTFPIETAMAGIPGLEYTRSLSRSGFSQVTVVFAEGVDIYFARQQVAERLGEARENMPSGADPRMGPITTGLGEIYMYAVEFAHPTGKGTVIADGKPGWQTDGSYLSPEHQQLVTPEQRITYLRTVQDWIIKPQLKGVPDIAGVDSLGGYEKQYVVQPDPKRLLAYGIPMRDVAEAIERNNQSIGAPPLEINGESYVVRSDGRIPSVAGIGAVVLATHSGTPIRVSDVAEVTIGREVRSGSATKNGEEVVIGTTLMLIGGNSRTAAEAVHERLAKIGKSLPNDVLATPILNRSTLVDSTIHTVEKNLIEGASLVIIILFLLLANLRGALIAALVIPLSMLIAAIWMTKAKVSGNLMSLGALDFGIIVDTSVILVENCLLRLGERQHALGRLLTTKERLLETFVATREMAQPTVFGQLIIMTVYLPILTLTGVEGKMFTPMAQTVLFALVAAFILTLTVVPALVALLMRGKVSEHKNWAIRTAEQGYARVLRVAISQRWVMVGIAALLFAGSLWIFGRLGKEFIPKLDEGDLAIGSVRIPSVGVEQSTRMQREVERVILGHPEVAYVFSKTGTAEVATDPMPPSISDGFVILKPRSQWPNAKLAKDELGERIEQSLAVIPGQNHEVSQPIENRFNELIAGVRADIAVKVFGDRYEDMLPVADEIAKILGSMPGAEGVRVEQVEGQPSVTIDVDRGACSRLGLNMADVQGVVATALGGQQAGMVFEGDRRFAIVVRLGDEQRLNLPSIERLPVPLPSRESDGGTAHAIPLKEVARVTLAEGLNQVSRENGKRRVVVQANVRGSDLGSFVEKAQRVVDEQVKLPAGIWLAWGGQFENLKAARERLEVVVPACLVLIFILLFTTFNSIKYAALVFTSVPMALTGGVIALWVTGMPFSISAAVGFIALSGVAVLNGMVVVSAINHLRRKDGLGLEEAIAKGSLLRLRAMVMTALLGALGYVPMALATGPGAEVQKPLAIVVIGGIISSALLTMVVLPGLYRIWHRTDDHLCDDDHEHLQHAPIR
ncbi:MAG: CusA/CzcA family heavy metal efflux RND transporter [Planctomycetes bacterium]|nr:CusA/CzcA family heavy metal efflux RND transporter [Planctomycetota bacterium]